MAKKPIIRVFQDLAQKLLNCSSSLTFGESLEQWIHPHQIQKLMVWLLNIYVNWACSNSFLCSLKVFVCSQTVKQNICVRRRATKIGDVEISSNIASE